MGKRVKAVGAGHSFNDLSQSDHVLVKLDRLDGVLTVDSERGTVRVRGGTPLHTLIERLTQEKLALPNIGAWMQQTVAGVVSTGTHGTSANLTLLGTGGAKAFSSTTLTAVAPVNRAPTLSTANR